MMSGESGAVRRFGAVMERRKCGFPKQSQIAETLEKREFPKQTQIRRYDQKRRFPERSQLP